MSVRQSNPANDLIQSIAQEMIEVPVLAIASFACFSLTHGGHLSLNPWQLHPDVVLTSLWFWTYPLRPLWASLVVEAFHSRYIPSLTHSSTRPMLAILSDDVHGVREYHRLSADVRSAHPLTSLLSSSTTTPSPLQPFTSSTPLALAESSTIDLPLPHQRDRIIVRGTPKATRSSMLRPSIDRATSVMSLEQQLYRSSDLVISITSEDRRSMEGWLNSTHTSSSASTDPVIGVVPMTGHFDEGYTSRWMDEAALRERFASSSGCVFVGNGQNQANVDAVRWLINQVGPFTHSFIVRVLNIQTHLRCGRSQGVEWN